MEEPATPSVLFTHCYLQVQPVRDTKGTLIGAKVASCTPSFPPSATGTIIKLEIRLPTDRFEQEATLDLTGGFASDLVRWVQADASDVPGRPE